MRGYYLPLRRWRSLLLFSKGEQGRCSKRCYTILGFTTVVFSEKRSCSWYRDVLNAYKTSKLKPPPTSPCVSLPLTVRTL